MIRETKTRVPFDSRLVRIESTSHDNEPLGVRYEWAGDLGITSVSVRLLVLLCTLLVSTAFAAGLMVGTRFTA